jgi:hypothetical protein
MNSGAGLASHITFFNRQKDLNPEPRYAGLAIPRNLAADF